MPKLMNHAVEPGGQDAADLDLGAGADLDMEATVEVLNRILHMELSGVMQHFHHRWVSRWLRTSRPRAVAVGQHIASLQGGPAVDIGQLMEDALAGSADILNEALAHEEERLAEYRKLLELVAGRSDGLEAFARTQIAADERILAELSAPPAARRGDG
jgi:bacterioferritin (cytochrome b1)